MRRTKLYIKKTRVHVRLSHHCCCRTFKAVRRSWKYSRFERVWLGAITMESPVCTPRGSKFWGDRSKRQETERGAGDRKRSKSAKRGVRAYKRCQSVKEVHTGAGRPKEVQGRKRGVKAEKRYIHTRAVTRAATDESRTLNVSGFGPKTKRLRGTREHGHVERRQLAV